MYTTLLSYQSLLAKPIEFAVAICLLSIFIHKAVQLQSLRRRNPARLSLPPGPKGYPFIGSFFEAPTSHQWYKYAEWAKVYGDVFSFEVLGQRIIVLNTLEAVRDLFDRRSANYSDRPRMPMLVELMNFGYILTFQQYGSWWRRHRRLFNEHFHASTMWRYRPSQARETRAFLHRLLQTPDELVPHIRQTLAAVIMDVVYGIKIEGTNDSYIRTVEESVEGMNAAAVPGAFLVDMLPFLKYVPSWFPGASFKRKAIQWAEVNRKVLENPFDAVEQRMKQGTADSSLVATMISALPEHDGEVLAEEKKIAQDVAAVAYVGGADTTFSAIQSFFLAMAKHPEVQRKAQAELDTVIGPHRLPEFSDRPSLPYINAIVKETMRWQLVVPLAVAHLATNDDVYRGYFIPKGSVVMGNAWAILHDKEVFDNPDEFQPERYIKDGKLNLDLRQPEVCAFGFGRRICPGRFFSDNTLFALVASVLHTFRITPAVDKDGNVVPLPTTVTSGLISYPEPFKVDIKPRSAAAEGLIREGILGDK